MHGWKNDKDLFDRASTFRKFYKSRLTVTKLIMKVQSIREYYL